MISMYANVIDKINTNPELLNRFYPRLKAIVVNTHGIGWGFHDDLYYLFAELSTEDEED